MIKNRFRAGLVIFSLFVLYKPAKSQETKIATHADTSFVQQVGFTDLSKIKEVLEYRLPDWGYTVFSIQGSSSGYYKNDTRGDYQTDFQNPLVYIAKSRTELESRSQSKLQPHFKRYDESELRIRTIEIINDLDFQFNSRRLSDDDIYNGNILRENTQRIANLNTRVNYSQLLYSSKDAIYFNGLGFNLTNSINALNEKYIYESSGVLQPNVTRTLYQNNFNMGVNYSWGFGRIRNVTPMITALRLIDRSNYIGKPINTENNRTQGIAEQFAIRGAYSSNILFRPEKYFWDDLFQKTGINNQLSAFEVNYLQETTTELMGSRLQGYRFEVNPGLSYSRYDASDYDYISRETNSKLNPNLSVLFSYYDNPSLNKQFGSQTGI